MASVASIQEGPESKCDLTTVAAATVVVAVVTARPQMDAVELSAQDQGHRRGNFHNYYTFHPPSHRLDKMQSLLDHIVSSRAPKRLCTEDRIHSLTFNYCDLGCNEGDLTVEIAQAIQSNLKRKLTFHGIDMDSKLIERANSKWKNTSDISGSFQTGDLCRDLESFVEDSSVDLISLLSTTMWIHIHVGDAGLKQLLQCMCRKTRRFLLIEPQPSKCYRNAMVRLRKMGMPEVDVSSERLQWRPKIEEQIQKTIESCGFQRVNTDDKNTIANQHNNQNHHHHRTAWNRSIQLYEKLDHGNNDIPTNQGVARKIVIDNNK